MNIGLNAGMQTLFSQSLSQKRRQEDTQVTQNQEAPVQKQVDYNKPMTPEEIRGSTKHAAPTLGAAVAARGVVMPPRSDQQEKGASDGQSGRQGGQERPSHSSYYSPVPVGGMAMPKRGNTIGDAVIKNEAAVKKSRGMSL